MNQYLLILIVISELFSIYLLTKVWRSDEHVSLKLVGTFVGLIPFIGIFGLLFAFDMPDSQPLEKRNTGARGDFTHFWISNRGSLKKKIKDQEKKSENKVGSNDS